MLLSFSQRPVFSLYSKLLQNIHYSKKGTFTANPETVFSVVRDTHKYSEFIPWCNKSTIVRHISNSENYTQLTIAFQKVKQLSYLSHVLISGENDSQRNYKIQSTCKEQPLKSLVSIWSIEKNSIVEGDLEQSMVEYSIEYEFSSPILQLTSHLFLDYVGEAMWVIFKQQAEKKQKEMDKKKKKGILQQSNNGQSHITFGKSNFQNQPQQPSDNTTQPSAQIQATNLTQYLSKNSKLHQIYCTNKQFKQKLDRWSKMLEGTNDFELKLQFKIKNYLVHKN